MNNATTIRKSTETIIRRVVIEWQKRKIKLQRISMRTAQNAV